MRQAFVQEIEVTPNDWQKVRCISIGEIGGIHIQCVATGKAIQLRICNLHMGANV